MKESTFYTIIFLEKPPSRLPEVLSDDEDVVDLIQYYGQTGRFSLSTSIGRNQLLGKFPNIDYPGRCYIYQHSANSPVRNKIFEVAAQGGAHLESVLNYHEHRFPE